MRISSFVSCRSSRMATAASVSLRSSLRSEPTTPFLISCWVMVEPPSSMLPALTLRMKARPMAFASIPLWS